jgi:hypothetical protein
MKKYKVTCSDIGYEDTIEATDEDNAECDALVDIGMNIQEYIEVDIEELKK